MPYDASFYEDRLKAASDPRRAVWDASEEDYERCRRETAEILKEHVREGMWILDAGCGIGELVECLPDLKNLNYLGIDYCGGFIDEARKRYPDRMFEQYNLLNLPPKSGLLMLTRFDLVICRTIEGVIGQAAWETVVENLLKLAPKVIVFRAMLADGEMAKTVQVHERR